MQQFNRKLGLALGLIPLTFTSFASIAASQNSLNKTPPPPLQHATNFQAVTDISQFLVSEKLDGMRAYWNGSQLLTRSGKLINAPHWFIASFPPVALDGELWLGRAQFENLMSIVSRKKPQQEQWKKVKYMVFDLPDSLASFESRYQALQQLLAKNSSAYLHLVKQQSLSSSEALTEKLSLMVAKGAEGLMLHRKTALYQARRTDDIQKLKPFNDDEATVVRHIAGKGKYEGMLGAIEVINQQGVKFKIGSGFDLNQRRTPPPIDSIITYRYRGKTKNNIPRFATYLRQRNEL